MINKVINNPMFKQLSGIVNLACPFIFVYINFPDFALSILGISLYSLLVGLYILYINYSAAKHQVKTLLYAPSGSYVDYFNHEIKNCGLDATKLIVRYAYTGDNIAMSSFDLIILDPVVWKELEDPEALKVRDIVEKHVIPTLPIDKKILFDKIKDNMSLGAQRFIFRHELGHVFHNYSYKKLFLTSLIAIIITTTGLIFANSVILRFGALFAFVFGIILSFLIDLLLVYVTNYLFKVQEEYKADIFAAKYSSKADILAAADFFEKYEYAASVYRQSTGNLINLLPTTILIGYIDGVTRAKYLRVIASNKN